MYILRSQIFQTKILVISILKFKFVFENGLIW